VPMFIEGVNRLSAAGGQAEHAGDVRTALAARTDHLPGTSLLAYTEHQCVPCLGDTTLAGQRVLECVSGGVLRRRPVGQLERVLEELIVRTKERGEPPGVA